jgi:exodeoxyribonuclease VII large subunit
LLAPRQQKLDEIAERLPRSLAARAGHSRADLNLVVGRLRRELLDQRVERLRDKLDSAWSMAGLVHPDRPLRRGFARVTALDGATLTTAEQARAVRRLELHFADGVVPASVEGESAAARRPVERKRGTRHIPPQPGLFDPAEE